MTTRKTAKGKTKPTAKNVAATNKVQQDQARVAAKLDPRNNNAKIDDLQKDTEDQRGRVSHDEPRRSHKR